MKTSYLDGSRLPDFQKEYVFILVVALGLILSVYFEVPGFIYKDDAEMAVDIAENNEFMSAFKEQNEIDEVSTSNLENGTVQELRDNGDLPESTSDNVYIVDYVKEGGMGVSAYVDVSRKEVVDNKYNYRIN